MSDEAGEMLSEGNGGWVRYEVVGKEPPVFLRFADRQGRLVPVDMFVPYDAGIDATLLRRLPLRFIEAWANDPDVAAGIRGKLHHPAPLLRTAAGHFSTSFGPKPDHWVARMLRSQHEASGEPTVPTPRLTTFRARRRAPVEPAAVDARLSVPPARPYGDDFYRSVASVYQALAVATKKPAEFIANANGVPATTAHRWIREARRREFLPAGVQGKAG